ncbi:MAG: cyclic nucleotide-binding protein [Halobacteriovorax sp.]|nr:cyclic nucleotide-binding protein [Halobacteriovorax sp.]|tara:strand:- start:773 stop:1336 length:564 start_codon:yes stop_codon:yes gene_type:complete
MYDELFQKYQQIGGISNQAWTKVVSTMHVKSLDKAEIFLRPGDSSHTFALILDGVGRHYYVDDQGKEWTKSFAGPGDLLGAYAEMLQAQDSRTFIEAVSPMKVIQGGKRELDLMHTSEWDGLWRKLAEDHFIKKENREYEFLKFDALARYQSYMKYYQHLDHLVPRKFVASYLGITPQALSRITIKN